jgi:hypothetical protein
MDVRETQAMATEDDRRTAAYRDAGLCHRCASHVSKGHALGFRRIPGEPCMECRPIVATFPEKTCHPAWRKWPKGRVRGPSDRSGTVRHTRTSTDRWTDLTGDQA